MPSSRSPLAKQIGWRAALAALAIGLAGISFEQYRSYAADRAGLVEQAREAGLLARDPRILQQIEREPDPAWARLRLARALLAASVADSPLPTAGAAVDSLPRLELARDLAAEVAATRPASWEAPLVQGAATYLSWSLRRDPRLLSDHEEWEEPLRRSLQLAPGRPEPARVLAASYLELWPALGRGKRDETRSLLRRALAHRPTLVALLVPWLERAESYEEAFSVIPQEPWAWDLLLGFYSEQADWEGYQRARGAWHRSLEGNLRRNLAEAEARLRGGDEAGAQPLLLGILAAPPRRRYAPFVESALALCTPEACAGAAADSLRAWLTWNLDLCLWRECPLPPLAARRLAELAGPLDPPLSARAALAGGELPQAEMLERRAEDPRSEAWAPYWIAKARVLTAARELAAAEQALAIVAPSARGAVYWQSALLRARQAGDQSAATEAEQALKARRRREWSGNDWTPVGSRDQAFALEILPERAAGGLAVQLHGPDRGAVAEVILDGELVAIVRLAPSANVSVERAVDGGPHRIEAAVISGGVMAPGRVRLRGR